MSYPPIPPYPICGVTAPEEIFDAEKFEFAPDDIPVVPPPPGPPAPYFNCSFLITLDYFFFVYL